MFEKVNPNHPDKIADRIAGALVDLAYAKQKNPKIAVEVLIGHGDCVIITESSVEFDSREVIAAVARIAGLQNIKIHQNKQDAHLAKNQAVNIRCGDNGIFKGVPATEEQKTLSKLARDIYAQYPADGKYILDGDRLIVCQSQVATGDLRHWLAAQGFVGNVVVNPLGDWTGGLNVDTGAVNRKLGSDMGDSVTGGGLHGKDLSKADVSVNIYAWLKAQETGEPVAFSCAIGDSKIDGKPYSEIVAIAREYIDNIGGFEKFAEWGLI